MKQKIYPIFDPPQTWWLANLLVAKPIEVPGVTKATKTAVDHLVLVEGKLRKAQMVRVRSGREVFPTWDEAKQQLLEWWERSNEDNEDQILVLRGEITLTQHWITELSKQGGPKEV